jgi:flagellin-like hook-associated protein FlgL
LKNFYTILGQYYAIQSEHAGLQSGKHPDQIGEKLDKVLNTTNTLLDDINKLSCDEDFADKDFQMILKERQKIIDTELNVLDKVNEKNGNIEGLQNLHDLKKEVKTKFIPAFNDDKNPNMDKLKKNTEELLSSIKDSIDIQISKEFNRFFEKFDKRAKSLLEQVNSIKEKIDSVPDVKMELGIDSDNIIDLKHEFRLEYGIEIYVDNTNGIIVKMCNDHDQSNLPIYSVIDDKNTKLTINKQNEFIDSKISRGKWTIQHLIDHCQTYQEAYEAAYKSKSQSSNFSELQDINRIIEGCKAQISDLDSHKTALEEYQQQLIGTQKTYIQYKNEIVRLVKDIEKEEEALKNFKRFEDEKWNKYDKQYLESLFSKAMDQYENKKDEQYFSPPIAIVKKSGSSAGLVRKAHRQDD